MAATQALTTRSKNQHLARPSNPIAALTVKFPSDQYNVLAPVIHVDSLPEGTRLEVTEVQINPDPEPDKKKNPGREVFPISGGELLIGRTGLDRIAQAAGISWDEERRVDRAAHPHYVEMFVKGRMTDFSGNVRTITGSKAIDLREDAGDGIPGKDYEEIVSKAEAANRDPERQLREARKAILEVAATKARNRAIAMGLAIKRAYTAKELEKPFIVPKLALDPRHAAAKELILANAAGATAALFASRAQPVVDATFEEPEQAGVTPPPQAAGEEGEAPSSSVASPSNTSDEDKPGSRAALDLMIQTWGKAKERGMDAQTFKGICQVQTGKAKKEEMTLHDVEEVASSCEAYFANQAAAADELPV